MRDCLQNLTLTMNSQARADDDQANVRREEILPDSIHEKVSFFFTSGLCKILIIQFSFFLI
jgi:hypothetical protein